MARYTTNTQITLTDEDLPAPGATVTHEFGPYTVLIEHGAILAPIAETVPEPAGDDPAKQFVPVVLKLVKGSKYHHAARWVNGRVAAYALCNGISNGRPVASRDRNANLGDVNCPRCLNRLVAAGAVTLAEGS